MILAIDTSSSVASVACELDGALRVAVASSPQSHFEELSRIVRAVCNYNVSGLSEIRIALGPGSFTGLRIGVSFAKGLACALKIPLRGVPSYSLAALQSTVASGRVMVLGDARKGECFVQKFRKEMLQVFAEGEVAIVTDGEVAKMRADADRVVSADEALTRISDVQKVHVLAPALFNPTLLREAVEFNLEVIAALEPLYVRAAQAKTIAERAKSCS